MNWKLFLNPFEKYEARILLVFGFIFFFIGSFLAAHFSFSFDGALDLHRVTATSLPQALKENLINVLLIVVTLFILGIAINRKTRFVDMLNGVLIFRIPFYFALLLNSIPVVRTTQEELLENIKDLENFEIQKVGILLLAGLATLLFLVYSIILLFNGFRTAVNAKRWQHYLLFAIVLLFTEIVSKIFYENQLL